jgi:hypothetical protein
MVESILNEMQFIVAKHGLNLMQTYPNDLLVHDRRMLERCAHNGASIAWMAGHSHTHLVNLGVHREENEMVHYLTNLASEDRFYTIKIFAGDVAFKEVDRKGFDALANTPVPYIKLGQDDEFALFKREVRVGKVRVTQQGSYADRLYVLEISAEACATKQDHMALHIWAEKAAAKCAGTLFVKIDTKFTVVQPAVQFA